jgi:hypothetical protein
MVDSREALAIEIDVGLSAERVKHVLDRVGPGEDIRES